MGGRGTIEEPNPQRRDKHFLSPNKGGGDDASPGPDTSDSKFFSDLLKYVPGRLLPAGGNVLVIIAASQLMPPGPFGEYGIVVATVILLSTVIGGWMDQAALRYYAEYKTRNRADDFIELHSSLVLACLAVIFSVSVLLYPLLEGVLGAFTAYYPWTVAILLATVLFNSSQSVLRAGLQPGRYSVTEGLKGALIPVFSVPLLLLWKPSVEPLLAGLLLATVVPLPFSLRASRLLGSLSPPHALRPYASSAALYGLPMVGWFVGSQILEISDRFLIQFFRGSAEVGIYHANYQLFPSVVTIGLAPLIMAAHPILMDMAANRRDALEPTLTRFSRYFILLAGAVTVAVVAVAPDATELLLGEAFWEGSRIVPWVVLGLVGWRLGMYVHKRFEIAEKTGVLLFAVTVSVTVNLGLNILLIPRIGYMGAAIATAISYWIYPLIIGLLPGAEIVWRMPVRAAGAAVISSGVVFGILAVARELLFPNLGPIPGIVLSIACVSLYPISLLLLREVSLTEMRMLMNQLTTSPDELRSSTE